MTSLFNEQELLERVDHDWEFLGDTVEMLAVDGPALLLEMRQALEAGDAKAVGRVAHTLKGMIANFCAADPHATAFAIEQMGRTSDLSDASPAAATLDEQLRALTAELQALLARGR